jgi:hypothetical protein
LAEQAERDFRGNDEPGVVQVGISADALLAFLRQAAQEIEELKARVTNPLTG